MEKIQQTLKSVFGYTKLKKSQKLAITSILNQKDTFALLPTGGGKSLCYQLPALILPDLTIVISPLIALMKEQVEFLQAQKISAAYLNSSQSLINQQKVIQQIQDNSLKILYVSAEKATQKEFFSILNNVAVSLIAVDEAHCISAWGHDFRPDYTRLGMLRKQFPNTPVVALTATADIYTREDICKQLELKNPTFVQVSFDRPNISLLVKPANNKFSQIIKFLSDHPGEAGIIYALTRKKTELLAKKLQSHGISAESYHAGLSKKERSQIQTSFQRNKIQIVCATIAFGMGIDKANIRFVIHYNLPKNIENYYQELGRAGRDDQPATSLLLYSYNDFTKIQKFFINRSQGEIQFQKLLRMKDYAQAVHCRRKVLLQYFGETYKSPCNNCDVCSFPYDEIQEKRLGHTLLMFIQSMSKNKKLISEKHLLTNLKKSKAFSKYSQAELRFFLSQLKNLGFIQPLYNSKDMIELNQKFLEKKRKISLVSLDSYIQRTS